MEIGDKRCMATDSCSIPPIREKRPCILSISVLEAIRHRETIQIAESETAERSFGFMYCLNLPKEYWRGLWPSFLSFFLSSFF